MTNKFTPVTDLETLYSSNFNAANVSTISDTPTLQRIDEILTGTTGSNGLIQFGDARLVSFNYVNPNIRHEVFQVEVDVFYKDSRTVLREIVGELDRIHNANNVSSTRSYNIKISYVDHGAESYGKISLIVTMTKEFVEVPT